MPKQKDEFTDRPNGDWFRQRHLEDLEREIVGARARGDNGAVEFIESELKRLGSGHRGASKRPAGDDKEIR